MFEAAFFMLEYLKAAYVANRERLWNRALTVGIRRARNLRLQRLSKMSWSNWPAISLKEITDSNSTTYFLFLNCNVKDSKSNIKLSLLNGNDVYHCEVTADIIKDMAKLVRIPVPEFISLTISAFTTKSESANTFIYDVRGDDASLEFTWKKVAPNDDIKIKLGTLEFQLAENTTETFSILNQLSLCLVDKEKEIQIVKAENEELKSTNRRIQETLETQVKTKEDLEKEMYTKFVILLNKKKEKCKAYKDELAKLKSLVTSPPADDGNTSKANDERVEQHNSSLVFSDSDDSLPRPTQRITRKGRKRGSPSSSVQHTDIQPSKRKSGHNSGTIEDLDTQELMDDF